MQHFFRFFLARILNVADCLCLRNLLYRLTRNWLGGKAEMRERPHIQCVTSFYIEFEGGELFSLNIVILGSKWNVSISTFQGQSKLWHLLAWSVGIKRDLFFILNFFKS